MLVQAVGGPSDLRNLGWGPLSVCCKVLGSGDQLLSRDDEANLESWDAPRYQSGVETNNLLNSSLVNRLSPDNSGRSSARKLGDHMEYFPGFFACVETATYPQFDLSQDRRVDVPVLE